MHNDSVETLLARHYGSTAPAPAGLEQRLSAALHQEAHEIVEQQQMAERLRAWRVNRRRAVKLVALGSASLGAIGFGLELAEAILIGQEATQTATP